MYRPGTDRFCTQCREPLRPPKQEWHQASVNMIKQFSIIAAKIFAFILLLYLVLVFSGELGGARGIAFNPLF